MRRSCHGHSSCSGTLPLTTTLTQRQAHRFALRAGVLIVAGLLSASRPTALAPYFPPPGDDWERRAPEQVGLDPQSVKDAVALAVASETDWPRNLLQNHLGSFGREPHGETIGPLRERGPASGMIVRKGYIVAEWGDPHRVDVTFSVTKSFVSTTVGLAYDRKMIRDLDDRCAMTCRWSWRSRHRLRLEPMQRRHLLRASRTTPSSCSSPSSPSTIARLPGITCFARRATGRARSGANPTGPTGPRATWSSGRRAARRAGHGLRVQ